MLYVFVGAWCYMSMCMCFICLWEYVCESVVVVLMCLHVLVGVCLGAGFTSPTGCLMIVVVVSVWRKASVVYFG